MISNIKAFKNS